jgi:hypothetical protein
VAVIIFFERSSIKAIKYAKMNRTVKAAILALPVAAMLFAASGTALAGRVFRALEVASVGGQAVQAGAVSLTTSLPAIVNINGSYTNSAWRDIGNMKQAKMTLSDNGVAFYGPQNNFSYYADRTTGLFSLPWTITTPGIHELTATVTAGGSSLSQTVIVTVN